MKPIVDLLGCPLDVHIISIWVDLVGSLGVAIGHTIMSLWIGILVRLDVHLMSFGPPSVRYIWTYIERVCVLSWKGNCHRLNKEEKTLSLNSLNYCSGSGMVSMEIGSVR